MTFKTTLVFSLVLHTLLFIVASPDIAKKSSDNLHVVEVAFSINKNNTNESPNKNLKKMFKKVAGKNLHSPSLKTTTPSYHDSFINFIQSQAVYPKTAAALKQEGEVTMKVTLNRSGLITKYHILKKSPHQILNLAALKLIAAIKKYKPLPGQDLQKDFTIPIRYILN